MISPTLSRIYGATQLNRSAERVTVIPLLARTYPNARIIFSGGNASLLENKGREADYLYPMLDTFGVPRERVTLENRARNTYENAVFTKELAKPRLAGGDLGGAHAACGWLFPARRLSARGLPGRLAHVPPHRSLADRQFLSLGSGPSISPRMNGPACSPIGSPAAPPNFSPVRPADGASEQRHGLVSFPVMGDSRTRVLRWRSRQQQRPWRGVIHAIRETCRNAIARGRTARL